VRSRFSLRLRAVTVKPSCSRLRRSTPARLFACYDEPFLPSAKSSYPPIPPTTKATPFGWHIIMDAEGYSAFGVFSTADAVPEKTCRTRDFADRLASRLDCCDEPFLPSAKSSYPPIIPTTKATPRVAFVVGYGLQKRYFRCFCV